MLQICYLLCACLGMVFSTTFEEFEPAWKSHLAKQGVGRSSFSRASDYPPTASGYGNAYPASNVQYLNGPPPGVQLPYPAPPPPALNSSTYLTLIPGSIVDSDVKCGGDNRNFCNYPELPFIETLNVPSLLASANRLNRLPSGRCPDGYSKLPTMDCLNIAAAFIETTCCVYNSPAITLTDYCSNRQGLLFTATFELCDGRNFIVAGSNAWQVDDSFRILGGPYSLGTLTGGVVSSGVDSALVDSSCNVGFFTGTTLKWMNFPGKAASTDQTLSALLGTIPTALCGGSACTAALVNFAVCPNNGFCVVSVTLVATTRTVYKQLFFLAPGFSSYIAAGTAPPGIAVLNQHELATNFQNYNAATYIKSTNQIAFFDSNNNVYFYDSVGRLVSGPTNLFDLFGICGGVGSTNSAYTIYVPYPIYGIPPNGSAPYPPGSPPQPYQAPSASANYGPPPQQAVNYAPPPLPVTYDTPYPPPIQQYQSAPPTLYRDQPPPQQYKEAAYTPAPVPQQYGAAPQPQMYQAPPAPPIYQAQPTPAPQYQPPPPPPPQQYQPAPAPVYQAPPAPQYQPAPVTPSPQRYELTPAPTYQPPPTPALAQYQAPPPQYQPPPTQPPQQYQFAPAPPAPQQYQPASAPTAEYQALPNQPFPNPKFPQSPATNKDLQASLQPVPASQPQPQLPPQGPPIRRRTSPAEPAKPIADPTDNTISKPEFKPPAKEFFDVSAFIRKGDIDKFQPARELKLV